MLKFCKQIWERTGHRVEVVLRNGLLAGLSVCPIVAQPAGAQNSDAVMIDVAECIIIVSAIGRFACYEELAEIALRGGTPQQRTFDQPRNATISRSVTPASPANTVSREPTREPPQAVTTAPSPGSSDIDTFGTRSTAPASPAFMGTARVTRDDSGREVLHDVVAGLVEREPNRWLITLGSGQVWYQANSERYRLREGMNVRIYPSPMGSSYRLAAEEINGFIQVNRVE